MYGTLLQRSDKSAPKDETLTFTLVIKQPLNANAIAPEVEVVAPKEFLAKFQSDTSAYLLDVRRPEEFAEGHLSGARLINWLQEDEFKQAVRQLDRSRTIYVYCRSGRRSGEAARYLASEGYRVVDMDGGILAWTEQGLPLTSRP